jgi:hypothetical protein
VSKWDAAMNRRTNMQLDIFMPQNIQSSDFLNLMRIGDSAILMKGLYDIIGESKEETCIFSM